MVKEPITLGCLFSTAKNPDLPTPYFSGIASLDHHKSAVIKTYQDLVVYVE